MHTPPLPPPLQVRAMLTRTRVRGPRGTGLTMRERGAGDRARMPCCAGIDCAVLECAGVVPMLVWCVVLVLVGRLRAMLARDAGARA